MKLVKENLGDILKPKSKQEIKDVLDSVGLNEKMQTISEYYGDMYVFISDFLDFGEEKLVYKILLKNMSNEDLKNIVLDLIDDNYNPYDTLLAYSENLNIEEFLYEYDSLPGNELEEILNELLLNRADILSKLKILDDEEYEDYF